MSDLNVYSSSEINELTPITGDMVVDSDLSAIKLYDGSAWKVFNNDYLAVFENRWGASFDGSNDRFTTIGLQRGGSEVFTSSTDPVSMSGWFKLDSFVGDATIFGFGRTQTGTGYSLNSGSLAGLSTLSSGALYFHVNGGQQNIPVTANTGQWYHAVVTHDSASGAGVVYIDGSQVHTYTKTGNGFHSNISAYIGVGRWNYAFTDGTITDVAIWDSVLSSSDVTTLYNSGKPGDVSSLSPAGWWRMGDDSSDSASNGVATASVTDSSGNGNTLIQGAASQQPTWSDLTGETIYV